MYFVAVCRMCVNYSSFVDLEGFLHLNSLLKRHPSGLFSGLFIIFNVAKFCSDYVNLKPMPPAVSPILAYMMCGVAHLGLSGLFSFCIICKLFSADHYGSLWLLCFPIRFNVCFI